MEIKNGALAPMPKACPNSTKRYLFAVAQAGVDLALLFELGMLLWIA